MWDREMRLKASIGIHLLVPTPSRVTAHLPQMTGLFSWDSQAQQWTKIFPLSSAELGWNLSKGTKELRKEPNQKLRKPTS